MQTVTDVNRLHLHHYGAQMLNGARATDRTVAHTGHSLLYERLVGPVDRILEGAGDLMVVLRGNDD